MSNESLLSGFVCKIQKSKNIIVMTGAGISTNANIPDFRSESSGLYNKLDKYNLPHPTAVFSLDYFKLDPRPFYDIVHDLYPIVSNAKPTIAHHFIKLLDDKNLLLRHYTQNVDCLEDLTGLGQEKTVQAHGHIRAGTCLNCGEKYSFDYMKSFVIENKMPTCAKCSKVIKPDVVLFGESMNKDFFKYSQDFPKCDLLIVIGTSLVVQPFASLIMSVSPSTSKLFINKTKLEFLSDNDLFYQSDCDQACLELARLLGWETDLRNLLK